METNSNIAIYCALISENDSKHYLLHKIARIYHCKRKSDDNLLTKHKSLIKLFGKERRYSESCLL